MGTSDDKDAERPPALCALCSEFTTDLLAMKLSPKREYPLQKKRWMKRSESTSDAYQHHDTLQDLQATGETCELCALVASTFADKGADGDFKLELCPFWSTNEYMSYSYFTATFSDPNGPERAKYPDRWRDSNRIHIVRRRPYDGPAEEDPGPDDIRLERNFERALPRTFSDEDALNTASALLARCVDTHPLCARRLTPLPTRVIDVGSGSPDDPPRLYITQGETAPYIALSHCWGGNIPCKTIAANLTAYQSALPEPSLPQNFRDAILLTRALSLRYVWIDALCIIQDSPDDWKHEAARMASIYAGAHLTVAAVDAARSTEGFLQNPRAVRQVLLDENWAIREQLPTDIEMLAHCALNSRGWCAQERLLPAAVLHYGRAQMLWECATEVASEKDGLGRVSTTVGSYTEDANGLISYAASDFVNVRREFAQGPPGDVTVWYKLIEDYSGRDLTFGKDKLPAVAGIAQRFRDAKLGGEYIAGMWMDDLARGLFWSARTKRLPRVKVPGFHGRFEVTRPADRRMPSWSWTSVDGPVQFHTNHKTLEQIAELKDFEVLEVICSEGLDDFTAESVKCALKIRAPMLRGTYMRGKDAMWEGVGGVYFTNKAGESGCMTPCVMDVDPERLRDCWMVITSTDGVLVVEEIGEGRFVRSGLIQEYNMHRDYEKRGFEIKEFILE